MPFAEVSLFFFVDGHSDEGGRREVVVIGLIGVGEGVDGIIVWR